MAGGGGCWDRPGLQGQAERPSHLGENGLFSSQGPRHTDPACSPGEHWLGKTQVAALTRPPRHGPRLPEVTMWTTQGTLTKQVAAQRALQREAAGGQEHLGWTHMAGWSPCVSAEQTTSCHLTSAADSAVVMCWTGRKCFGQTNTSQVPCSHCHGIMGKQSQGG